MAQNLKSCGILVPYQPVVKRIALYLESFSVFGATTIDMIDGKKYKIIFPATRALASVVRHYFCLNPYPIFFSLLPSTHNVLLVDLPSFALGSPSCEDGVLLNEPKARTRTYGGPCRLCSDRLRSASAMLS